MKHIILFIILFLLFLVGCQTQYTNENDSCPELNCLDCPSQIEYQTKEVEKKVYIDKPVYQFQCFDGSSVDTLTDCPEIIEIKSNTNFQSNTNFCTDSKNYKMEKISIKSYSEETGENLGKIFSESEWSANQWYPSLQEGWIGNYPLKVINEGCTKIDKSKITVSYYLYHNDELIFKQEKTKKYLNWLILQDEIYPQSDDTIRRGIFYDDSSSDELFKLSDDGEYIIRIKFYYNNIEVDSVEDLIIIK